MQPRSAWADWLMQMSSNLAGTLLAAGVVYIIGVIGGAIRPNTLVSALSFGVGGVLALATVYNVARYVWPRGQRGADDKQSN